VAAESITSSWYQKEEFWNISKNDLLVLKYYQSFTDFRIKIGQYSRTKHFKLNMRNYLVGKKS
jgi:hypothetical protein